VENHGWRKELDKADTRVVAMNPKTWKWLAGAFLVFLLAVAIAADRGTLPQWIKGIYRFPNGDRVGHFALYGILAFLSVRAYPRQVSIAGRSLPLAVLVVVLLAALEELSQFWFPLRTPDWLDLTAGILGIFTSTLFKPRTG